jgi:hypothetical protein
MGHLGMNRLAPFLMAHVPSFVKRQALVQLWRSTAAAFECEMPQLRGLSREECLLEYARFTARYAEQAIARGDDLAGLQERLYRNAYRLGRVPGWLLGVRTTDDVMAVGCFLYSVLDIEFQGNARGGIVIGRCYFSDFYSAKVCRVMAAMDRGLLAGLAGGGELVFSSRITEGHPCCRAHFASLSQPSSDRWSQENT